MRRSTDKPRFFFPRVVVVMGLAWCALFTTPASRAQSSSNSPAAAGETTESTPADATAKPAAKPKHVYTNDDMPSSSSGAAVGKDGKILPGPNRLFDCDASCEHAARNYLGYDTDDEPLWRSQIVKARMELTADNEWRGLLNQAIAQTNYYCNFLAQREQKTAPSNNSYNARVQRSQNAEYFESMERSLRMNIEATMNRMQQHIQEVHVLSPVRAAMMYVQADRIFSRDCDSTGTH